MLVYKISKALAAVLTLAIFPLCEVGAEPLQGRIEHVQKMQPVSKMLKPGIKYDDIANQPQSNVWVKIPGWLVGTWQVNQETAVYREDFRTGQHSSDPHTFTAKSKFDYGKQIDKTGQIWHYLGVPYTSITRISGMQEYHLVKEKELMDISEHRVAVRTKVTVVKVKRPAGDIAETYQQESITWYNDKADGTIRMESSTKAFDAEGKAVSLTRNQAQITRVVPFHEINEEYGKDLKALFHQYLQSHNLANLIPAG